MYFGIGGLLPENNSIKPFDIPTDGMANTLKIDDMIIADMDYYKVTEVKRNDIVIFSDPALSHKLMIKRAIALESEKISIINGKIFINGKEYKENNSDIIYQNNNKDDVHETVIPEDCIFVMGDNRPNSLDSRNFGSIMKENVKGKPLYIYFSGSFNRIGINLH